MSSLSISHDLIGKMVWVFTRDDRGVRTGDVVNGIVIEEGSKEGTVVVMLGGPEETDFRTVWMCNDIEEMEGWDEEMEGEDCSMEET